MYVIDLIGKLDTDLSGVRYISVFKYYGNAIEDGIEPLAFFGVTVAAIPQALADAVFGARPPVLPDSSSSTTSNFQAGALAMADLPLRRRGSRRDVLDHRPELLGRGEVDVFGVLERLGSVARSPVERLAGGEVLMPVQRVHPHAALDHVPPMWTRAEVVRQALGGGAQVGARW